jgi:predicted nucleic acid-binding protein
VPFGLLLTRLRQEYNCLNTIKRIKMIDTIEKFRLSPLSTFYFLFNSLDLGEASVIQLALNEDIVNVCIEGKRCQAKFFFIEVEKNIHLL